MGSLGIQGLVGAIMGLGFYGVIIFVIWKFYQVLSKINDHLGEIKQAIAGIPVRGQAGSDPENIPAPN